MKNVLVTGASRGIGYQTALAFARGGHRVVAISRNKEALEELKQQGGDNMSIAAVDICAEYRIEELLGDLETVDILINNAGMLVNKPFGEISMDELRESYEVNVFAPYRLLQGLLPYLSSSAHIINIGSVGGVNGTQKFPGLSAYSSSKAAMSSLSECWQAEFAETDWTFNSLALGAVQTEMLAAAFPGYEAPVSAEAMANYILEFALTAPPVMRGKVITVSRSNP